MAIKKSRFNRTNYARSGKFAMLGNAFANIFNKLGGGRLVLFAGLFAAMGVGLLYLSQAQTQLAVACPTDPGMSYGAYGTNRGTHYHAGIDIGVDHRPIYAAGTGRIIFAGTDDQKYWGYQKTIDLQSSSGRVYRYAHLSEISVSVGQGVQAGQRIGTSGDGDGEVDAHLHWEIRTDGGGTGFSGTIDPSWAYEHCGGDSPPAGAVPTTGPINNTGTDCHNYVLQYDPGTYYPCVRHLQNDLGITADGYFGPATRQAVISKQAAHGLNQTGTVDAATWCVIHTDLAGCASAPAPTPAPAPAPTPSSQAVQGRIFRDDNGNGAREGSEPLIGSAGACGSYVNVDASVAAAGQHVNADRCMDGPFYFIPTGVGTYTVSAHAPGGWSHTNGNSRTVSVAAGQHVDVQWFGMRPTPAAPVYTPPAGTTTTTPAPTSSGTKTITGVGSNRCIDVAGASRSNGAKILLWDCHGQANQQWAFVGNAIKVYGSKCLDIFGFNTSNMAEVGIWDCHGQSNQQWYRPGDGTIRSNLNGKCLDVEGYGTHNGARILMYDCHGQSNQKWR